MALLEIERLSVSYHREGRIASRALDSVSLALEPGQTLGVVGESGSGKTTLGLAILGLLPRSARFEAKALRFGGVDLRAATAKQRRALAWTGMAYVPQSAMNALDPVTTLGVQFQRIWRAHRPGSGEAIRRRAVALFDRVGLDPRWLDGYAHELSGGMRQRAAIAMALMFEPSLLIADEPTTGLDVIVQRQVLDLLKEIRRERGMALILISHDIAVVAETCRLAAVIYAGRIMELGSTAQVLNRPLHPYTMGLREAFPDLADTVRPIISIPGAPPRHGALPDECPFVPRCPFSRPVCRERDPPLFGFDDRWAACHFASEADAMRSAAAREATWDAAEEPQ